MKHTLPLLAALLLAPLAALHAAERVSVIENGGFEQGAALPSAWTVNPESVGAAFSRDTAVKYSGEASGRIVTTNTDRRAWPAWEQKVTGVKEGQRYEAKVWVRMTQAQPITMAYLTLDYRGADGKRVSHAMSRALHGNGDWVEFSIQDNVPSGAATMVCRLILHGPGKAWFDDASLVRVDGWEVEPRLKAGLVRLRRTGLVYNKNFGGFGAEIDPLLWTELQRSKGVNEADVQLIASRVREMRLSLARVFVWSAFASKVSGDKWEIPKNSDGMQSLEKTLQLCQTNGIEVILCGVPVGFGRLPYGSLTAGPQEQVDSASELLEYLIKKKGFTCIRWWQVMNEPDCHWLKYGYDFDRFVLIHKLMQEKIKTLGLSVRILGSGDAESLQWFTDSVRLTSAYVGGYGGSRYTDSRFPEALTTERETAYFAVMRTLDPQWRDRKYIVTEFGIRHPTLTKSLAQTKNSTDNAYMRTFDFSLSLAAVCMTEVAVGIDAASLWVLHDVYYSKNHFMKHGLWGFKGENWQPRPAWYAYSLFTRFMTRGSRLSHVEVNGGEDLVTATLAQGPEGCFLFVLNQSYGDVALAAEIASPTGHWVRYTCDERVTSAAADRPLFEPGKAMPYSGELRDRVPRRSLVVYQLQ